MKTGEIVEYLIGIRDRIRLTRKEDQAVCEACNILDRFPAMTEYIDAKEAVHGVKKNGTDGGRNWVCFYHPDGHFLGGYSVTGTFAGEAKATRELLAAENGVAPSEIAVRVERKPPSGNGRR